MIGKGMGIGAGRRSIESGKQYDSLFSAPIMSDPIMHRDGDVDDTLKLMGKIAADNSYQVKKLAAQLTGASMDESCRNIWNFVFQNIQYNQDKAGVEQLRTPSRTWADRKQGVDCDCMSIFESALLREMNIPHRFRVVKFSDGDFEHVYVVVPRNGNSLAAGQIIMDAVLHGYNKEKQYNQAQDYSMSGTKVQLLNGIPIQVLNGVGKSTYSQAEVNEYNRKLKLFLQAQRDTIAQTPSLVKNLNPQQAIYNLNYAISTWDNPHNRVTSVQVLADKERQFNPETSLFRSILSFFNGEIGCHDVCEAGYINLPDTVMDSIQGSGTANAMNGITNAMNGITNDMYGDPIVMNDPNVFKIPMATPRGAFLTLVRLNAFNLADKLAVGFFPVNVFGETYDGQWYSERTGGQRDGFPTYNYAGRYSAAFGLSTSEHLNARRILFDKVLRRWNNFGGEWKALKEASIKGAHKMLDRARPLPGFKYWCLYNDRGLVPADGTSPTSVDPSFSLNGLEGTGLGEPVTAAVITAAGTVLVSLLAFFSSIKKPGNASVDPATGLSIPTNPTTNPDPTGHPDAVINPATGMWYSAKTGETYDIVSKTWIKNTTTSSFTKYALIAGALILGATGIYYFMGSDEKKVKKQIAK